MTARQKATHIYYTKSFFGLRQTFGKYFFLTHDRNLRQLPTELFQGID